MLATAEGTPFTLSDVLDASGLAAPFSASIDWGDGVVTSPNVTGSAGGGRLVGRVDYSLDTNNFFNSQLKRNLLQQAVDSILSQLGDDLAAIMPSGGNTWTAEFPHPGTGALHRITNMQVAANELVIFAGGRGLGSTLGTGGPGGFQVRCTNVSFCDTVTTRGELGTRTIPPTDFGPWGGAISFNLSTDFHFSQSTDTLGSRQTDFLSVALHEFAHLLGIGTSGSWNTYVSNGAFIGPASRIANGNQSVPLTSDRGHWANGTTSDGRETALDPSLQTGTRKLMTPLDFAGLDDVGWDFVPSTASVSGSHIYGDDGVYNIVVTVRGSSGLTVSRTLQETVTNAPPTLSAAANQAAGFRELFTIVDLGVFTDPGFGASETFVYTIDWGDGSALDSGMASIDSPGSAGVATTGSFDGTHRYENGGVYEVTLTVADDDRGTDSATLHVTVPSVLSVEIAADQITENDGPGATTLTVTRHSNDLSQPLVVFLSTDSIVLDVPSSVVILPGNAAVVVPVNAVDNESLDGTRSIRIVASATDFLEGSDTVIVVDHQTLTLALSATTVLESDGAGAILATVTRNTTDIDAALEITISLDDETEASAPSTVVIPAGEKSITFPIDAIEDGLDDGPQLVSLTVAANGYEPTSVQFFVSDVLSWHNARIPWDVDGDGQVSPIDALRIINDLGTRGSRQLPELAQAPPYLDVNNDGFVSPIDALLVVNFINNRGASAEGESSANVHFSCDVFDTRPLPIEMAAGTADAINHWHRTSRLKSEREIVLFTNQFGNTLADDLIADIISEFNRRA
ncbi:MAG TPA: dockerin type I domain-containing protein [Pirellulaceae bacterium]|nr:dockerin type I domain-containing protein [Pirellulaceae bacterium]